MRGERLRQGEILSGIQEFKPEHPGEPISLGSLEPTFTPVNHPLAIVITPDCDLLTDFLARQSPVQEIFSARLLQHIHCCDLYEKKEIRDSYSLNSNLWRRVTQNQNERYHRIPSGKVADQDDLEHPALYMDFKRMFTMPTEFLYGCLATWEVERLGIIPPIWIHDLIQRYFAFHSRIGVPDPHGDAR